MHHVRTLKLLLHVYMYELKRSFLIEEARLEQLFPGVDNLLSLHQDFLNMLKLRQAQSQEKGSPNNYYIAQLGDILIAQVGKSASHQLHHHYVTFRYKWKTTDALIQIEVELERNLGGWSTQADHHHPGLRWLPLVLRCFRKTVGVALWHASCQTFISPTAMYEFLQQAALLASFTCNPAFTNGITAQIVHIVTGSNARTGLWSCWPVRISCVKQFAVVFPSHTLHPYPFTCIYPCHFWCTCCSQVCSGMTGMSEMLCQGWQEWCCFFFFVLPALSLKSLLQPYV